ncbi:MAG: dipeptidyl carboxypeptidase, partial [Devosia sp.]|uniref:M3 family metallopeptidase n=1 Tax=Devosia sp. TaxID=1871048 RepID=UPI002630564B
MLPVRLLLMCAAVCALAVSQAAAAAPKTPHTRPPKATAHTAVPSGPGAVFAKPSSLFLHAPDFSRIKDTDFQPAMAAGRAAQLAEVARIAGNPAAPTFDNTIVALARSGEQLSRASSVFSALTQANTNPALQKIQTEESPKGAAHRDAIVLNPRLFSRVKAVYDQRERLKLNAEQKQLVKVTYDDFVHSGANLSPADKVKLKALNETLSVLGTAFQQKLLAGAKAGGLVIDDKARLAGLSDGQIAALASAAKARGLDGKWVIPLQNTTQQPLLKDLADRSLREQLFNAGWTRTERGDANDTRETIVTLAQLRADKARLLGHPTYADYVLETLMAENPAAAEKFMAQLVPPARARAAREAADIQKVIDADGPHFDLKPWDWDRYAERVRLARYNLSDA